MQYIHACPNTIITLWSAKFSKLAVWRASNGHHLWSDEQTKGSCTSRGHRRDETAFMTTWIMQQEGLRPRQVWRDDFFMTANVRGVGGILWAAGPYKENVKYVMNADTRTLPRLFVFSEFQDGKSEAYLSFERVVNNAGRTWPRPLNSFLECAFMNFFLLVSIKFSVCLLMQRWVFGERMYSKWPLVVEVG